MLIDMHHGGGVEEALDDGMDDTSFCGQFRPILSKVMEVYDPKVVVLPGDKLGTFNLSARGHVDCMAYQRSFNIPLMVLGGGGYTINNIAKRCNEVHLFPPMSGVALGIDLEKDKHVTGNAEPDFTHEIKRRYKNKNTPQKMEELNVPFHNEVLQMLSRLTHKPSVPFHNEESTVEVPEEEEESMEKRPEPRIQGGLKSRRGGGRGGRK